MGTSDTELLYQDLTKVIRQSAYEVHSYFGTGFLEKVYENALAYSIRKHDRHCEQQVPIKVYFENNIVVGEYVADMVVENKIIIELKAIDALDNIHFAQLKNYLKATKYRLDLLINFGGEKLQFKRIIL